MKCKYPSCPNEARPVSDPKFPDYIHRDFCSYKCHEMFLNLRDMESRVRQEHRSPENTMLRIEQKLDKIVSILEKE